MVLKKSSKIMSEPTLAHDIAHFPIGMTKHVNNAVTGIVLPIFTPKKYEGRQNMLAQIKSLHQDLTEMFHIAKMGNRDLDENTYKKLCNDIDRIREHYIETLGFFETACTSFMTSSFDRSFFNDDMAKYRKLLSRIEEFAENNNFYLTLKTSPRYSPTVSVSSTRSYDDDILSRPSSAVRSKPTRADSSAFNRPKSVAASLFDPDLRDDILKRSREHTDRSHKRSSSRVIAEKTRIEVTLENRPSSSTRGVSQRKAPLSTANDQSRRQHSKGLDDHALDIQLESSKTKKKPKPSKTGASGY